MGRKRKNVGTTMVDVIPSNTSSSVMDIPHNPRMGFMDVPYRIQSQIDQRVLYLPRFGSTSSDSQSQSTSISRYESCSNTESNESIDAAVSGDATSSLIQVNTGRRQNKPTKKWSSNEKLLLELTVKGEIDGPDRAKFETQLGVLARNTHKLPLTYKSFDLIPQHTLDDLWKEIMDNTTLPDEAQEVVMRDINSKWKQWTGELKRKCFKPYMNNKEKLDVVPTDKVSLQTWLTLVQYWQLPETQKEAEKNSVNISQYKDPHRLGRTPMLEVRKELLKKNDTEPSRIELFAESRARKGKDPVNDSTTRLIVKMNESISKVPEQERTKEYKEKVWTDYMGSDGHGRVRCVGQGVTASQYQHSLSFNDIFRKKIREEVMQEMREEIKEQVREQIMMEMNVELAQEMAYIRGNIRQQVVEEVVSYFGLGNFPITPFLSSAPPSRRYDVGQIRNGFDMHDGHSIPNTGMYQSGSDE